MPTVRFTLEYDGTNFVGWQYQPNGRSVQEEVEKAIKQILQSSVRVVGGGRTDAGVHARGQVASFSFDQTIEINTFAKSLNAVLPEDIVIRDAKEVTSDFNARYSAKARRYKYYISNEPVALRRNYCWQIFYSLDVELMQRCSNLIFGEHDFRSFCRAEAEVKNHQCNIKAAHWMKQNHSIEFDITANRFLRGMVRALVGTIVDVGRGYTNYDEFIYIMQSQSRADAGMSAPAKGLFLEEIIY